MQHLPSYLGLSYLGRGVSLHGCSSKAQPLLLTLDEGYLLTAAVPDLQCGIAPLGPPVPAQPLLLGLLLPATGPRLGHGWLLPASAPGLGLGVAPQGHRPWPRARGCFSRLPLTSYVGCLLLAANEILEVANPHLGLFCSLKLSHRSYPQGERIMQPENRTIRDNSGGCACVQSS